MDPAWEKDHLWLYLLALDFEQNRCPQDGNVGWKMFDILNYKDFAAVALFLFTKLDKDRAKEISESHMLGVGTSLPFRQQCCNWLREISFVLDFFEEKIVALWNLDDRDLISGLKTVVACFWNQRKSGVPKITTSSLISPLGADLVHTVYRFARYVMIEDMKKLSVGRCIPLAKPVELTPEKSYIVEARHRVGYKKLLQILQKQDIIIQEYGKRAQVLIKEIEETKSEYAVMELQSSRMKQNDQNKSDTIERIEKVHSMWTVTMEMLTSLKKDKKVVDSVLEMYARQCILGGTDVLRVPRLLTHRTGSDKSFTEKVYEDGKLNLLAVIQVFNEVLTMLRNEQCQSELKELHRIENMIKLCNKLLQDLNTQRLEREQQHCVLVCESISKKEEDCEMQWKTFFGQHPCNLFFKEDLEPSATPSPPQSPSLPEEEEDSDLHQHLASASDIFDSLHKERCEKDERALETVMDEASPLPKWISSVMLELLEVPESRDLLIKNNLHTETCGGNEKPVSPQILENGKEDFLISEMQETAGDDIILSKAPVEKEDLLEKARDKLAEEVAKAVISESLDSGEEGGMSLDGLICSLYFNPFITRREIPRTPENLQESERVALVGTWQGQLTTTYYIN